MRVRVTLAFLASVAIVAASFTPATAVTEGTPIQAGPEHEWRPAAAVGWLVWSEDGGTGDLAYNTWAKADGSAAFKINDPGTLGLGGGIDGTTVIYQQVKGSKSDLKIFDLNTMTNSNPPAGINTKLWEWGGKISPNWILFNRNNLNFSTHKWQKVILYDRSTQHFTTLDSVKGSSNFVGATSVSGDKVAWTKCVKTCDVYVYDTVTKTKSKVPGPKGLQYDGTLLPDGTLYFVHDGGGCGRSAKIMRWTGSGAPEAVGSLPKGYDAYYTFGLTQTDGSDSVYYTRWKCSSGATDIYSLDNADTLPPLAPVASSGGGSGYLRPQGWAFGG